MGKAIQESQVQLARKHRPRFRAHTPRLMQGSAPVASITTPPPCPILELASILSAFNLGNCVPILYVDVAPNVIAKSRREPTPSTTTTDVAPNAHATARHSNSIGPAPKTIIDLPCRSPASLQQCTAMLKSSTTAPSLKDPAMEVRSSTPGNAIRGRQCTVVGRCRGELHRSTEIMSTAWVDTSITKISVACLQASAAVGALIAGRLGDIIGRKCVRVGGFIYFFRAFRDGGSYPGADCVAFGDKALADGDEEVMEGVTIGDEKAHNDV